jgi:hypothetical protein
MPTLYVESLRTAHDLIGEPRVRVLDGDTWREVIGARPSTRGNGVIFETTTGVFMVDRETQVRLRTRVEFEDIEIGSTYPARFALFAIGDDYVENVNINDDGWATLDEAMTVGTDLVLNMWGAPDPGDAASIAGVGYVVPDATQPGGDRAVIVARMQRVEEVRPAWHQRACPLTHVKITIDYTALAALEALKGGK